MRILLDTNVIFSAFAARGLAHSVFELCIQKHTVIISREILRELEKAFRKKLKLPAEYNNQIIDFLTEVCTIEKSGDTKNLLCRDKNDLHILGLAIQAKTKLIITGDEDLLVLKKVKNIPIISPRDFWQRQRRLEKG